MGNGERAEGVLRAAYEGLLVRCRQADEAGDWQERLVLEGLADIADYVARIGHGNASSHYRAEKAGPLLRAAILLQREVFLSHAGWPDDDSAADKTIDEAVKVLDQAAAAVRQVLWGTAAAERHGDIAPVYRSTAHELTEAARLFSRWAEALDTAAAPDPEGVW